MKELKIGISPCPNDTFIFEAIHDKKIDLEGFTFQFVFEDVQTLNKMAIKGEIDIIKISYAHYFNVIDDYIMLRSGGAMGKGVGPLLISKKHIPKEQIHTHLIAIPGSNTTANFLLQFAFPNIKNTKEFIFSEIEKAILDEDVDAGVIIHENRFTYKEKGLIKIMDLGEEWELKTDLPIPLGGIAIKRNLDEKIQIAINRILVNSIQYAFENKDSLSVFIKESAQEMNEEVMKEHIKLYVNEFSLSIGTEGEKAVQMMQLTLKNKSKQSLFINN